MNAEGFLRLNDLDSCKKALFEEIKNSPGDIKLRIFLFQLSCITEDWARASGQLDVIRELDDSALALVNTYTQLIDCEKKRQNVLQGNISATCFGEPPTWLAYYMQAYQEVVDQKFDNAMDLIAKGAELAPQISGVIDQENHFEWIADGDMRFGPAIEIILNGGYYWLPMENIRKLEFEPVEDLRDLVWRPVNLTLKNNGTLIGFVPVRYPTNDLTTDTHLLAKTCDWSEPTKNLFLGNGQRIFISENKEFPLLNISSIEFNLE
ncbi:type VI secretion system accessory protein TagJ [Colwellia sp. KU-HH00111]|uniref:type VI secretion system accessory protein TagJ n=1 Tax=Colwellia sp. KU-HH00111 TaxID=3127652 RepID=UPI0031034160